MLDILRRSNIARTARVKVLEGLFDLPPIGGGGGGGRSAEVRKAWSVPLDSLASPVLGAWNVGLVTGPSGAGKSVIAGELLKACGGVFHGGRDADGVERPPFAWPGDRSVVDGFPKSLDVKAITGWLSSVGFSSPPSWLTPYGRLSNGQQFRANLARCLAEASGAAKGGGGGGRAVVGYDEFGSLVDRQVRQVAAAATAKAVRRAAGGGLQFVAVTCHDDVAAWLEADWVLHVEPDAVRLVVYTANGERPENVAAVPPGVQYLARGSLRRPDVLVDVVRLDRPAAARIWPLFKPHHYLSGDLATPALCHLALAHPHPSAEGEEEGHEEGEAGGGRPAAFVAVLPFPHPTRPGWREHRCVCLPDWQGVGVGNAVSEHVASLFRRDFPAKPYFSTTSHPGMIAHRLRSGRWRCVRRPGLTTAHGRVAGGGDLAARAAVDRISAGFEYVGPPAA